MRKVVPYIILLAISTSILMSCKDDEIEELIEEEQQVVDPNARWRSIPFHSELQFEKPVEIVTGPLGSNLLYILEQEGIITQIVNETNNTNPLVFLDIRDKVVSGGELGLLGMAFHPNFEVNGQLYVHYTRNNGGGVESVISMIPFPKSGGAALVNNEEVLLSYRQPFANHNAGSIHFGNDGMLYITTGDGGSGGDPRNFAQNPQSFLGKILRINVDQKVGDKSYSIPADNPFVNQNDVLPEIYALGLRNPWKMTKDRATGDFWIADVGQNSKEEINILSKGANYGWKITEGFNCFSPRNNCDRRGLTDPIFDYGPSEGRSITGGYVYRGEKYQELIGGKYIYGDYVSGSVWALDYNAETGDVSNQKLFNLVGAISSFGETEKGEILILNYQSGKIEEIVFD